MSDTSYYGAQIVAELKRIADYLETIKILLKPDKFGLK